jgi:hypothetical protein
MNLELSKHRFAEKMQTEEKDGVRMPRFTPGFTNTAS